MPRILIVEDDALLGELLSETLKKSMYEVRWAHDGVEGLEQIKDFKPNLILLDVFMPKMDGYGVLAAKAKDLAIKDIPVIIISNSGEPVEIHKMLELGVSDYLVKVQLTPKEVLEKVNNQFAQLDLDSPTTSASPKVSLKGKKILWVEDDDFLISIITQKFVKEGATLIISKRGSEAIALAEKEHPDIIMLDFLMPEMNGLEILTHLKSSEKTKDIPVIMFSNLDDEVKVAECRKLGALDFFVKANVNLDEVVNKVKTTISHSHGVAGT